MDRAERYAELKLEIESLVSGETYVPARYASAACLLAEAFRPRFFWTGFYVVDPQKPEELVVGPYQGTLGCLRIPFGKGVCGHVASSRPGHGGHKGMWVRTCCRGMLFFSGTQELVHSGTQELKNSETQAIRNSRTRERSNSGTQETGNSGTREL